MDFFYFLVTSSKSWEDTFHKHFFCDEGGFTMGFLGALVVGVVLALAFYFGCCNSKKTSKSATITVWAIFLVIAIAISYFFADFVVIGDSKTTDNKSIFRTYSFYKANDDYFTTLTNGSNGSVSQTTINDYTQTRINIKDALDKGGDVRFDFDITTAILSAFFFFITSIIVKRFTVTGKCIPFMKP